MLIHVATWMNLEDMMLSESSHVHEDVHRGTSLVPNARDREADQWRGDPDWGSSCQTDTQPPSGGR